MLRTLRRAAKWLRFLLYPRDDLVTLDGRQGNVPGWGRRGQVLVKGSAVPHILGHSTYAIQTRQGGWVNIVRGKVESWATKPIFGSVVDLSGRLRSGGVRISRTPIRRRRM